MTFWRAWCGSVAIGAMLSMTASPAVAVRIGYDPMHFVKRHLLAVPVSVAIMFAVSLLPPRKVRHSAFVLFGVSLLMLVATFFIGVEIKGARRWIDVAGLGIQPSELVKPTFAIVAAWFFAEQRRNPKLPGNWISGALFVVIIGILIKQPDIGMAVVVATVWFAQFFTAGLRFYWLGIGLVSGASLMFAASRVRSGHLVYGMLKTPTLRNALLSISREWRKVQADALGDEFAQIVASSPEVATGSGDAAAAGADG